MSETLTYQTIKTANQAREAEELKVESRKKKLIILILHWLTEEGYAETAKSFEKETNLDLRKYDVCDNIDLDSVLQEYESYYYVRFTKYPKVIKKVTATNISNKIAKSSQREACKSAINVSDSKKDQTQNNVTKRLDENENQLNDDNAKMHLDNAREHLSQLVSRLKKPPSNVPALPKVGSNQTSNHATPLTRPTSVENLTKAVSINYTNVSSLSNQKIEKNNNPLNNSTHFNSDSTGNLKKIKNVTVEKSGFMTTTTLESTEEFGLSVTKINNNSSDKQSASNNVNNNNNNSVVQRRKMGQIIDFRAMINEATKLNSEDTGANADPADRLMKPLAGYVGYNSEWRELAQVISRDIYMNNPNVKWDDIIGLDNAKRTIKEAVVYPIKYPALFTGILSPWKGLLLYGPPGTGKTLLAKAVATECNTTFFNISASTIVSKWRGDSEKLVRVLFEMARFYAPSTIFVDELESIMSIRGSGGGGGEHEGSRRMKTELLVQMDGLARSDDLVFLLAASNIPWELDHAMLRRLEKRIIVDLPTQEARKKMFLHHLPPVVIEENGLLLASDLDYDRLASNTEGYSGSDIKLVCKEAAMRSVRKVFAVLENLEEGDEVGQLKLDRITTEDVQKVLQSTKPSAAKQLAQKYEAWTKEYESV